MTMTLVGDSLYQWDTGRYVEVTDAPDNANVGFALADMREALKIALNDNQARIPDELLQTGCPIAMWVEASGRSWEHGVLKPIRRKKPAEYVSTPTEAETYDSMKAWVLEQIEEATGMAFTPITNEEIEELFN